MEKSKLITFRVSKSEYDQLKADAEKQNQALSQYIKERVFRESNQLATTQKREVYFSLAKLRDLGSSDEAIKDIVNQECDLIWHTLKS